MTDILPPEPITVSELTEGTLNGTGVVDVLMKTMSVHLNEEYSKNRIKGAEYSQVYLGSLTAVMAQSTQFLLQKDQSYNQALLLAKQAELIELEKSKVALEIIQVEKQNLKLAAEITLMGKQGLLLEQQLLTEEASTQDITTGTIGKTQAKLSTEDDNLTMQYNILTQKEIIAKQEAKQASIATTNAGKQTTILQNQGDKVKAEADLLGQKQTTERAQTEDVAQDNSVVGKQMALYEQQRKGLQRDAEQKSAKMHIDGLAIISTNEIEGPTSLHDGPINAAMKEMVKGLAQN